MKSRIRTRHSAFSLIELLVVIAIIAVLAAIIFPVFAAVRENARRASCMTNLEQISSGLKQYELDNRRYPDFLLAPAIKSNLAGGCTTLNGNLVVSTTSGEAACTLDEVSQTENSLQPGGSYVDDNGTTVGTGSLYPEYVKSLTAFHCPDDDQFDQTNGTDFTPAKQGNSVEYPVTEPLGGYNANNLTPSAESGKIDNEYGDGATGDSGMPRYYKYDSYDSGPAISTTTLAIPKANISQYVIRYSRQWVGLTPHVSDFSTSGNTSYISDPTQLNGYVSLYERQLVWKNPGDDTIVTVCGYHSLKDKIIVLTLGGTAKVLDDARLKGYNVSYFGDALPAWKDFDMFRLTP